MYTRVASGAHFARPCARTRAMRMRAQGAARCNLIPPTHLRVRADSVAEGSLNHVAGGSFNQAATIRPGGHIAYARSTANRMRYHFDVRAPPQPTHRERRRSSPPKASPTTCQAQPPSATAKGKATKQKATKTQLAMSYACSSAPASTENTGAAASTGFAQPHSTQARSA